VLCLDNEAPLVEGCKHDSESEDAGFHDYPGGERAIEFVLDVFYLVKVKYAMSGD
jgi:hypothetical protein